MFLLQARDDKIPGRIILISTDDISNDSMDTSVYLIIKSYLLHVGKIAKIGIVTLRESVIYRAQSGR